MTPVVNNILLDIPKKKTGEFFQTLLSQGQITIERIVSEGHCSPLKQWYDQIQDEWIILIEGQAKLQFEHEESPICLKAGDYLLIPARTKHRVHWTNPDIKTIWLAIHIFPNETDHE